MKILHLFNVAGIAQQLVDYSNTHGIESSFFTTKKSNKWLHCDSKYEVSDIRVFYLKSLYESLRNDVIILHGNLSLIKYLKHTNKNLILYAHGTELRNRYDEFRKDLKFVKHIFVSTSDLAKYVVDREVTYIPNPVPKMFINNNNLKTFKRNPKAFTFSLGADNEAKEICNNRGLKLDILERNYVYNYMPTLFENYTHYIDVKRDYKGNLITSIKEGVLSLTALEALKCGLTVITLDGETNVFPKEHNIEYGGKLFLDTVLRVVNI